MQIFYKQELSEEVMKVLQEDTDDPILTTQDFLEDPPLDVVASVINEACKASGVLVFYSHNICIILRRMNAHIGIFDTHFGKEASLKGVVKAYKEFVEWLPTGTHYLRVESRTPLEKYAKVMAKAVGASIEGVMKDSYRTKDNKMINEYIVGYNITREIL